jgi:hypothetical protein
LRFFHIALRYVNSSKPTKLTFCRRAITDTIYMTKLFSKIIQKIIHDKEQTRDDNDDKNQIPYLPRKK